MRIFFALAVVLLGFASGVYELFQHHWFAGSGFVCSAFLTCGLILVGKDFITQSLLGACLAGATALLGFYGFLFENRALDVRLDQARFEAAMALAQQSSNCAISDSQTKFQRAAQACFLQSNVDKLAAIGDGAKVAYLPPQLDLADKTLSMTAGDRPDGCQQMFLHLYSACPAAFSSMSPGAIKKMQSQN